LRNERSKYLITKLLQEDWRFNKNHWAGSSGFVGH
jgi:hypothetical protein